MTFGEVVMKKILAGVLVLCLVLAGCGRGEAVPSSGGGPVASGAFSEPEKGDGGESSSAASEPPSAPDEQQELLTTADCERYIRELGFLLNSADWETAAVVSPAMYAMWYGYRVNDLPDRDRYLIDGRDGMFFPAEEFEQAILDRFAVSVEQLRSDPVIYLEKEQLYQTPMALMPLAESQIQVLDTEQDGTVIRIGFSQYFVDSKNMVEKELTLEVEEGTEEFRFLGYVDR